MCVLSWKGRGVCVVIGGERVCVRVVMGGERGRR